MALEIPEAVRAAAGLAATFVDEARKLPGTLPGLPIRLLGLAMQTSLRLQQQYSGLVARGDELLSGLWGGSASGVATFDEDLPPADAAGDRPDPRSSAFDRVVELDEDAADDLTVELSDEIIDVADTSPDDAVADAVVQAAVEGLAGATPVTLDTSLEEVLAAEVLAEEVLAEEVLAEQLAEVVEELSEDAGPDGATDDATLADVLAFDAMAAEDGASISDADVATFPADPPADAVTGTVDELAGEVDAELAAELPESVADEVADDLAADTVATVADEEAAAAAEDTTTDGRDAAGSTPDEAAIRDLGLVGTADATDPDTGTADLGLPDAATQDDAAPDTPVLEDATSDDAAAAGADATLLDDATPDVAALDEAAAEVTDLGAAEPVVAQPDVAGGEGLPGITGADIVEADEQTATAEDTAATEDTATTEDAAATDATTEDAAATGTPPAGQPPIEGYEGFSIPNLRGRLRKFDAGTVRQLLEYEQATQNRQPYVTLLSNRLNKLTATSA